MRYIDVRWLHESAQDPIRLVSELDAAGWEQRKLEFFVGGRVAFACATRAADGTALGEAPVPPLPEINAQSEFDGVEIDAAAFEALWREHGVAG